MLKLGAIVVCICLQFGLYLSAPCSSGECACSLKATICKNGQVPKHLPIGISEVFIDQLDLDTFNDHHFGNGSRITKLELNADLGTTITSKSFQQFSNLIYLGLHGKELQTIAKEAFHGLRNLLTLNLSSNPFLTFSYISRSLNAESVPVLPSLTSLTVSKVQMSVGESVSLNEYFFRSIASGRHLKTLDISELNIASFNFSHFEPLCNSLQTLVLRNSAIGRTDDIHVVNACTSLRTVDISEMVIPALRLNFTFQIFRYGCESLRFLFHTKTLLVNNVNTRYGVRQGEYFLNMSMCPMQIRKVSVSGNKIQWVNMTVKLHETTKRSLTHLNVSYNGLEYLSPLVLMPSENIRNLDLSNNRLNIMQEKYTEDFRKLFSAQKNLQLLNLSHNSLNKIPAQTFSENKLLQVLDISHNNLKTLDFSVKQLINLEKLIISKNKMSIIEHDLRMAMEIILSGTSNNTDGNSSFNVYLEGNPFQCTCGKANMRFIEWIHSTEVLDETETLTCILEADVVNIRGSGLSETKHFCRIRTLKKVVMITTPILSAVVITGIVTTLLIKKRRQRKLLIREVIAQIEMGTFPLPHLAFLSYCSEDTDLVMNKIYPELCKHLSDMTRSNRPLVCLGDVDFRPGFCLRDEVFRCVEESSVFVAIISRNFCRKAWCNLEIGEAYDQKKPIIMIMVEHVEKEMMDDFLQKIFDRYAHSSWKPDGNSGHIEPEWKIFCKSVIQLAGQSIVNKKYVKTPAEGII